MTEYIIILAATSPDGCHVSTGRLSPTDFHELDEQHCRAGKSLALDTTLPQGAIQCFRCEQAIDGLSHPVNGHDMCETCYMIATLEMKPLW
jgi:hypothetical protein